jgi:histidyl-tRNA synthetase
MQLPFKRDQIGYAANRGIPILVILGPDEAAGNRLTVRDLRSRRDEFSSRSGQILGIAA